MNHRTTLTEQAKELARDTLEFILERVKFKPDNLLLNLNSGPSTNYGMLGRTVEIGKQEQESVLQRAYSFFFKSKSVRLLEEADLKNKKEIDDSKKLYDATYGDLYEDNHYNNCVSIFKLFVKNGVGRCGELVHASLAKIYQSDFRGQIDFMETGVSADSIDNHAFIVLNRPYNTDATDWKTWGKQTIILDPWLRCYFTADKLPEYYADIAKKLNWGDVQQLKTTPLHSTYITPNIRNRFQLLNAVANQDNSSGNKP